MALIAEEEIAYMEASWLGLLETEFEKPYMRKLEAILGEEKRSGAVDQAVILIDGAGSDALAMETRKERS